MASQLVRPSSMARHRAGTGVAGSGLSGRCRRRRALASDACASLKQPDRHSGWRAGWVPASAPPFVAAPGKRAPPPPHGATAPGLRRRRISHATRRFVSDRARPSSLGRRLLPGAPAGSRATWHDPRPSRRGRCEPPAVGAPRATAEQHRTVAIGSVERGSVEVHGCFG